MFILKKIGCRIFQTAFRAALPILPYREPRVACSCNDLGEVFDKERVKSVLVVTDRGIVKNGLATPLLGVLKKTVSPMRYTIKRSQIPQ